MTRKLGLALAAAAVWAAPAIVYFTNVRELNVSEPGRQNYVVVDEEIWVHARADLGDVRLYRDGEQVPYVLREQRAARSVQEQPASVMNVGRRGGGTEFDVDVDGIPEYDRVRLQLEAKDFVVSAKVAGMHQLNGPQTELSANPLYDFSRESLGSNFVLRLPRSNFRYLHVRLSPGIQPEQVKGATVANLEEKKAAWTVVDAHAQMAAQGRETVVTFSTSPHVPVDRVEFDIEGAARNFRRDSVVSDSKGQVLTRGEISRIHMARAGATIVSEDTGIDLPDARSEKIVVRVENGDDAPLPILQARLLSLERRLYFDPGGQRRLELYYGDAQLDAPVYDYAKFFREDVAAARAQLGPGRHNARYVPRPDTRPWSERHSSVMWIAMVGAVGVLAALAVRGFKTKADER